MTIFIAALSVLLGSASAWYAAYWVTSVDGDSKKKRHFYGALWAAIVAFMLIWIVALDDTGEVPSWGWVILALVISLAIFAFARVTPDAAKDVLQHEASSKKRSELPSQKPFKPLTNAQRKAAKLPTNEPIKPAKKAKIIPEPKSRAIRTGWELCRVAFDYEDSNGDWSTRQVTVHSVTSSYIKGECHDRRAERTFRLDRVQGDITDLDTGEILSSDVWAKIYR